VLLGGATLPIQAGVNARLADWLGSPLRASFVSFAVGAVLLLAVLVAARGIQTGDGRVPSWSWTGGVLGAFYVVGAVGSAPRLGAAAFIAVLLAGQTVASLLADQFGWVGYEQRDITPGRIVGVALLSVGVLLVRF
jgi:bacterial/archaeal transporter family-2 protein